MDNSDIGTRMKKCYEQIPKIKLMRRCPVAIRIDGKAFHTFTRGFDKPYDEILIRSMQETMRYLCEHIQGCVLGYTQSDEITLILVDYQKYTSDAWFDYEVQKMCSIAASMATMSFNRYFTENVNANKNVNDNAKGTSINNAYIAAIQSGAMFDARCFNIPKEEVTNLIYWRQLDAKRNSVQMLGQAYFSQKQLQKKSCRDIQAMLIEKYGIDWNELPSYKKWGSCCIKNIAAQQVDNSDEVIITDSNWVIDKDIPVFKGDAREYVDRLVYVGE